MASFRKNMWPCPTHSWLRPPELKPYFKISYEYAKSLKPKPVKKKRKDE
jgi:hypothetical protein